MSAAKPKPPTAKASDPGEFFEEARAALAWRTYLRQVEASADPSVVVRVRRLLARYAAEPLKSARGGGEEAREHLALCRAARALTT